MGRAIKFGSVEFSRPGSSSSGHHRIIPNRTSSVNASNRWDGASGDGVGWVRMGKDAVRMR